MRKYLGLVLLPLIVGCGSTQEQVKVSVNPTEITPLKEIAKEETLKIPEIKLAKPHLLPPEWVRVYRCSYRDDKGDAHLGAFIWIKLRDSEVKTSF